MAGTWGWDDVQGFVVLVGLGTTAATLAAGWGTNKAKITENSARITAVETAIDKERHERFRIEREFSEFKERVVREFVAREHMKDVEERWMVALERISKQMDAVTDRLDRVLMKTSPPRS